MPRAAHLHAPQAQLHVRRAFREVAEVQDPVREELLLERRQLPVVPGRDLGDQEARRVQGLQEPEEVEELAARVVEAAQAVQGREAVDRDEVERVHPHALVDVLLEDVEPVLRELLVLVLQPDPADVEDVQLHVVQAGHAEVRHRGPEVFLALFQRDVEGLRAGLHVLVEDGEGQGRVHRPRGAGDEDERAAWDAAAERLVEALDVRLQTVHGRTVARADRRYKWVMGRLSCLKGEATGFTYPTERFTRPGNLPLNRGRFHADRLRSPRPSDRRERVPVLLALRAREWSEPSSGGLRRAGSGPWVQAERRAGAPRGLSSGPKRRLVAGWPARTFPRGRPGGACSRPVLPLNRGRFERRLRAVGVAGLPISGSRTYAGRDGPRGDPAGLVVLPPRLRREPDGGRLRRGGAHRFLPNPPGSRAALRRPGDRAGGP